MARDFSTLVEMTKKDDERGSLGQIRTLPYGKGFLRSGQNDRKWDFLDFNWEHGIGIGILLPIPPSPNGALSAGSRDGRRAEVTSCAISRRWTIAHLTDGVLERASDDSWRAVQSREMRHEAE